MTDGTVVLTTSSPPLIVRIICVFFATLAPALVPCEITVSLATVLELCTTCLYPSPTSLSALTASSLVIPSTLGTVTVSLAFAVDTVSSVADTVSVFSFLGDLVLPTSLTITNIVTISIITAIPIPIIFIIKSSLSLSSSSISTSSSSSCNSLSESSFSSSSRKISSSDNASSFSPALTSSVSDEAVAATPAAA